MEVEIISFLYTFGNKVLYTHQKMKKSKVWQDGILKISHLGNKVKPGDDLESDRYLITVEEVKVAGSTAVKQDVIKEAPVLNSKRCMSSGRSLGCQLAGLKRKFTGFQGPRQVPKKTVITENSEPAASLESEKPGPVFLSPLYNTPPLFSTVGKKDTSNMPTDSENIVTYKNRERNGIPFSSVISTPSFKINPEVLCEENYVCSPISSVNKHSDSLLTDESMKRDSLVSHGLGVSQNIRSKAQILALLKSTSTSTSKELNSEIIGHFPQIQPQGSLAIPTEPNCLIEQEEYAEVTSTESLHNQHQSENAMRNKSRWAMYLSSQSSPVDSSTVDGKNAEEKPKTQEGNLNLKDLSMQKRIQFFETCAEKGKRYNEDKLIDDNDQSWDQEGKLEISSFYENSSLPINCSIVVNDGLLLDSDIQKSNKRSVDQNDQIGIKGSILIREKAQEININGTPEKKYEHLQIESSLSNNSGISDDSTNIFSKSSTNNESLSSIHEPMSDISQPLVEVTFNLNNFETSDTEEESQESSRISQDSEDWVKETSVNSSNSRCENISCKEVSSEHLPLSTSIGDTLSETFPTKEILPSQFCDKTCVGYDTETWKAGNTGKEIKEVCSDTLSNFDSSLEWTDDRHVENDEGANKSISASFPSKSESMNTNLNIPHFLNIATDQKPENNPFSEQAQTRPLILGSDLDKNTNQVLPLTSSSGNSIQLLNAKQIHSKECIALDKSRTQASNSLCYPLGKTHISRDTESHISESEEVGRSQSLFQDHIDVETSGESKQYWNNLRNSSEISGLVNSISLLKSLAEHSTALEGLEVLKRKNTSFKQQGTLQTYESDSNPEARKPLTTIVSQATPKSPHLNQDPHQFFPLGSEEETAFLAVIPKQMERETCKDPKVTSPEQKISTLSPVSTLCFNSRDDDFMLEFSEESLKAQTLPVMKKSSSLENKNLQRLSFQVSRTQAPPASGPPDLDSCSSMMGCNRQKASGSPILSLCEESAVPSFSFGPKDQSEASFPNESREVTPSDVSLLDNTSTQSKWQKYQNIRQCNLTTPNRVDEKVTDGFHAEAVSGMHFSNTGERESDAVNESSLDSVHLQMIKHVLQQQQQDFSSQDSVCRRKTFSLNINQASKTEEIQNMLGEYACYNCSVTGDLQGRLFYTCDGPKADQCKFFKWFEEMTPGYLTQEKSLPSMVLSDIKSIGLYLRSQKIPLYEECQLFVRKGFDFQRKRYGKLKKFTTVDPEFYNEPKSKLYLKLSRKESSSTYSKAVVHALLVCNASTELTSLRNIRDYFNPATLPLTQYLITMSSSTTTSNKRVNKRKFIPPAFSNINTKFELLSIEATLKLASELIQAHKLNEDQAAALIQIAQMMASRQSVEEAKELAIHTLPITIIHGVFGAGKSYLLAVVILFFVQLFEKCEALRVGNARPWKLLISSSTNVAVDRVLLGLLSLGFEKFVRVGSVRKIAKPVLPYSLYAGSENENEQLKELHALMKEDLTPMERVYVRKSIEQHKLGTNKTLLKQGHKPILLRTQYRCHPTISAIANDLFYEGHLVNGISATERSPLLEWLPTLCFYDVKGLEQIERGNSFHNVAEAAFTLKLIQSLVASGIAGAMIGVITLYKSQMHKLCHLLSAVDFDHPDMKAVQVSTVDAFQGAEKEIIILSCVRTRQVGFIDSEKRMNVALTRGRRHLLIVGNLACLRKNRLWGHVIQHCEGREGGLQHASQYEPQLDHLLKDYLEKQAEEKQKKKAKKDKLTDKKSYSQKDMV
ncbi:hypothetical protein G4228_011537 [Cervus hanglu yarkandensis]|nr:hypothetical protein G4228_011537 [Cervus hanglu yarkandensis]